ncbi:MAG: GNAT family N-acetyltransferase [Syntrophomonadaceae bacterium]
MRPIIRDAAVSDAERLAALSTELGYPMTAAEAASRFGGLAEHPDHALLVAEDGGRVEGWIQVSLTRVFEAPTSAEIAGLVVDTKARGRGLGAALVAAAETWAAERGARALRVRCNVVRERAHAFYRRERFREIKTQKVFERPIERAPRG